MSIYTDDCVKKQMFYEGTTEISKYIVPGSLKKQEYLCTGQLNFGEVNSTKIQFKTYGNLNLTEKIISVRYGTDEENVLIGTYKVTYSSVKSNSSIVTVTAYDSIKVFDKNIADWYVAQAWPVKLKNLRQSLCEYIGIEAAEVELINDDIMVPKTVNPSKLNGMEMLFYIGQLNGVFAHAADTYSIEWLSLGTSAVQIPKRVTYGPTAFEAKSYDTAPIGGLVIRQEDGDVGVSIGTTNKYVVQGNILVYGYSTEQLTTVANRLYDKIKDVRYVPCSLKVKYLPDVRIGSMCSYDGNIFYVLQRISTGNLFDTLTAGGNEYLETDTGIESQLEQIRGKANVLSRTIEETRNTITDIEQGLKNEITATALEFDVKLQNLQSEIDGQIEVINGHGQPALDNYPAYNWTSGPKIGDKLVEGLRFTYSDEVYRKHQRTLFFDEDTATTYRFVKKDNVWIWEPLGNTEYSVLQKQITDLNVTAQGITESMEELSVKISNEYITQVAAETLVSKTANGIKEDISKVYTTKDDVSSFRNSIEKTAAGLTAQICEINEALDGANEVYTIRGQPTLSNYPAYNWTSGPKIGDKLVDGLRFTYTDESYRKHNRALVYDVVGGKTYRFVKNGDTWGFTDVGDTEFSWVNKKLAEYKATADEASVALSKLETKVGSDYITKVESQASIKLLQDSLTEQFSKTYATLDNLGNYSTTTQMNTAIETSAKGVLTTVSNQYATQGTVDELVTSVGTTAEGLKVKISKNEVIATINASAEQVQIAASKLDLQGLVTISSLEKSGETIINADNITTGTINALKIKGCEIEGSAIAFRNNSGGWSSVINADGMWIIGEGDADNPDFRVNNKGELTARRGRIGNWDIGSGAIANNGTVLTADGQLVLSSDNNAIQLGSNARLIHTALYVNQNGYSGSVPWWGVYKAAAQAVASDERIKQDIESISDEAYDRFFNSLQTYTYRFREGSGFKSDKTHIGFISQHIKKNLDETGLSCLAVYDDDNPDLLGVDKQELIALCVWQIQKLKARVKELETNTGGAA
jgi:hypothetical protein|nr:MAG TPA: Endo N acetylneuraminidase [Caudoviricetes sp.]